MYKLHSKLKEHNNLCTNLQVTYHQRHARERTAQYM